MGKDNERLDEINATINLIDRLCETAGIGIIVKDNRVAIIDSFDGQIYYLLKEKEKI